MYATLRSRPRRHPLRERSAPRSRRLLLLLVRWIPPGHRSSTFVLTWGGLRGGLSIALALSVPEALGRSWMLGATYLVVVFSIVFQGGSMDRLLRWRTGRIAKA